MWNYKNRKTRKQTFETGKRRRLKGGGVGETSCRSSIYDFDRYTRVEGPRRKREYSTYTYKECTFKQSSVTLRVRGHVEFGTENLNTDTIGMTTDPLRTDNTMCRLRPIDKKKL